MHGVDDPYAVLGLSPAASDEEVAAAYRELAKKLHPDVAAGPAAHAAMARLNAAHDAIRGAGDTPAPTRQEAPDANGGHRAARGSWLSDRMRAALGRELLAALEPHEDVRVVTPASTWKSPTTLLAVTDRRLLWLADDMIGGRVHQLRHADVAAVEHRVRRPLRRRAVVKVTTRPGRRVTFGDLHPDVAALVARNVDDGRAAA